MPAHFLNQHSLIATGYLLIVIHHLIHSRTAQSIKSYQLLPKRKENFTINGNFALIVQHFNLTDGHTAVDGAHIIPCSVSKNDQPQNGISLCKLCHWTFDEGMISISIEYKILLSRDLNSNDNVAGHLITFEKREIFKPSDNDFWPAKESIEYHQSRIFRKR